MSTASVTRLQRFRERQASGKVVLSIEVCVVDHVEMLRAAKLLAAWDDDDRVKIERATERLLQTLAAETRYDLSAPDGV